MLEKENQWKRLANILGDNNFINLVFKRSLSNISYISHIKSTLEALSKENNPDLLQISLLSYQRERIKMRSSAIPDTLPATTALLGHYDLAKSLADSFSSYDERFKQRVLVAEDISKKSPDKTVELITESLENIFQEPNNKNIFSYFGEGFVICVKILYEAGQHQDAIMYLRKTWERILKNGINSTK